MSETSMQLCYNQNMFISSLTLRRFRFVIVVRK